MLRILRLPRNPLPSTWLSDISSDGRVWKSMEEYGRIRKESEMQRLDRLEQDYREAKSHIYGLAHNICLNGGEQHALLLAIGSIETEMLKDGCSGKEIILQLMSIIIDGLSYGNWPWMKNGVNTLETSNAEKNALHAQGYKL